MRLSEAIRLGAMLKPQSRKYLWKDGKSCAFGAALDALGHQATIDSDFDMHALESEYPFLMNETRCPACGLIRGQWRRWRGEEYDAMDVVIHLNDNHKWSRQRIANWVSTIEPKDDPVTAVEPAQALDAVARP